MDWVIWNRTQRKWVGPAGGESAYVRLRADARRFPTRQAAQAECCGDEKVILL